MNKETGMKEALVLTADELAKLLGMDRKSVYDGASRGEIPCRRVGRRVLFPRAAIETWLSQVKP